ncbi:MAG TPA: Gfo/Idh/MocA family oxidoreductase, partial [Mycobacteriales bacterium]|nr:Gfo/Idh/MocA family oxidoreductase [Mycobacteriales bacterium]
DVDPANAKAAVADLPHAVVHPDGQALVDAADVDAVIVASWGPTHEEYVLACLAAGKPVFCEKPLATSQEACRRVLDAEVALGRRLVQVGFMRRYDPAYRAMKDVVTSGAIGAPLLVHSRHRNPSVPSHYVREMAITDSAVHDFDIVRWLLDEDFVSATVLTPRRSRHGTDLQDPLLIILRTDSGVLVDVETSANSRYGYDVGGEVVGEDGTVALADTNPVVVRREGGFAGAVPAGWRERFVRAYDVELQAWVDALAAGLGATGPSSWDGYAAAVASDAAVHALRTGDTVEFRLGPPPALYADGSGQGR